MDNLLIKLTFNSLTVSALVQVAQLVKLLQGTVPSVHKYQFSEAASFFLQDYNWMWGNIMDKTQFPR